MNTSEVLNRAADLIEERGWGTGSWSPDGPLCIEGAIAAIRGYTDEFAASGNACSAYKAVRAYLNKAPFAWNDNLLHRRTLELIEDDPGHEYEVYRNQSLAEGKIRVIEVLRATAIIEAARESEMVEVSA